VTQETRTRDAEVTPEMTFPPDGRWHHCFDSIDGRRGTQNPDLGRAAAFPGMLEGAGVDRDRVRVAVVVHGASIHDVTVAERYAAQYGDAANPNVAFVREIVDGGGEIWVCGVAAAAMGIGNADLLPGVRMAVSAMTAHAELQRRGFSLNPY
jgi:intracellular sulfur oxidation DsrE/DsrF family protein